MMSSIANSVDNVGSPLEKPASKNKERDIDLIGHKYLLS